MSITFRDAVTKAPSRQGLGKIVLARPLPMRVMAIVSGLFTLALVLFLVFGHYTRRVRVSGQVTPTAGSITVVTDQFGRITQRLIVEGQFVDASQPLFELTAERTASGGGIEARIDRSLKTRHAEMLRKQQLQFADLNRHADALKIRQSSMAHEVANRREEVALLAAQVSAMREKVQRYAKLGTRGFVSAAQLADQRGELAGQLARLKEAESSVLIAERDLAQTRDQAASISGQLALAASQAKQELATLDQEAAEHDSRSRFHVVAPLAGRVTALAFSAGQSVPAGAVLATIMPAGSALEAQLAVPAHARGFIRPGQHVLLRMSAFPYQKFGQIGGSVVQVDNAPLGGASGGAEPTFRVTVRLERQSVTAYGREQQFTTGMTLEADILQDRRRLIEWVFDPLISVAKDHTP